MGSDLQEELKRAAKDVDCAVEDLMLVTGKEEHIRNTSAAVAAYNEKRKKKRARAKNKLARKQRKANRK